ncbi:alpha-amylase family glycosyl hydrolase [Ancylomarina sp.]|uniref:alpha-amylase family glycosyl hydrolase n=1 Tax=Ancylomarina sp. TaxID=1970196 RepID=UPI003562DAF6
MNRIVNSTLSLLLMASLLMSCQNTPKAKKECCSKEKESCCAKSADMHLDWTRNANIYEVNIRQYTPEGTINAFANHLPRLKEMGVDILWLMPIFPISEKNRKGSMGSCYAVADYRAVNPDYGTLEDLKTMVKQAQDMGMKVILDWVANHTGWDNVIMKDHKDWYTLNEKGEVQIPAGTDWTDTADLNFDNKDLREYMKGSLKFWIEKANVDGYRCDMAGMVPTDFWNEARKELDSIKPVFMLAEAWEPELLESAFDMGYAWDFHHLMNDIAKGEKNANEIDAYFAKIDTLYQKDNYLMNFITNHDENSWAGTIKERMGEAANAFAVLTFTMPGMPMLYSGQEAGLNHRLKFFEKDEIDWSNKELVPFYTQLMSLKANNKALLNGAQGGDLVRIATDKNESVYAFVREKDGDKVVVVLNLSNKAVDVKLNTEAYAGTYSDFFTKEKQELAKETLMSLKAWEYRVYVK